ncbi:hypothetical protein Bbelb_204940 [Branchiostoma belcheri]|nr:hypothetical protein Bbelb_204940 [Branchiostoma belcheri]
MIAKVCEGFVAKWTLVDIIQNIDPKQFGGLPGKSTTHCLVDILHHLSSTADRRGTLSSIVLTDFSKAFDRVEHTTAISRLLELGCRPSLTRWICDFLSERRQRVLHQGSLSEWEILTCGLPQGTVLAPIIFLAMINSAAVKTRSTNWKFVDDLSMIESRLTREPSLLQHDLDDLEQWTANSYMKLHPKKCKAMHVYFTKPPPPLPVLYIDGHALQEVSVAKLLGVMVQSDLKWNTHVNHITSQSSRRLFLLRHLKRFRLPVSDLVTVYIAQIENIQRRACRIILGKDYSRYSDACSLLGLPSLQQRRQHLILKFGRGLMESPTFRQWLPPTRGETSDLRGTCPLCCTMFPTCHGRNLLNKVDTAPLRRPRKAEAASTSSSTKKADSLVPEKTENVPTCQVRNFLNAEDTAPLRRPRKAEAASTNRTTSPVPGRTEDVPTSTFRQAESTSVCVPRKTVSAPVSPKAEAVSPPSPVPSLPLSAPEDVPGPDRVTLPLLRELLSRVQYSADEEEAQEHIYNLYRHLRVDLCRDSGLAYLSRLLLLQLIELRAASWDPSPHLHSYYAGKLEKFPEIKSDDLSAPSNTSAVESLQSGLVPMKGFSPREPEESKKEEKKKKPCQETITVCVSLAAKVFEPAEKMRRLEERCRAKLECYPDADGEDCLVTITAESQAVIDHAVNVIEEAIAEVERQERQRRCRLPPAHTRHRPRGGNAGPAELWHTSRGGNSGSTDRWGNFQFSSYQDKIAARARLNGGTQGNGTSAPVAATIQRPVREETTATLVFSHRHQQNIIPSRPVPEPVPVFTPARPVQDDLDWNDVDDNSDLFVWRAHTTLASEVNRLAAVKEVNVGFDNQREVPSGKIKTKKPKQNAVSPTGKQSYSSTSSEEGQNNRIPSNTSYNNTTNTCKPGNEVNSYYGNTVPVSKAVAHQSRDTSQALTEKTSYEVVPRDRTPSPEGSTSGYGNSVDSCKANSFSEPELDTSLTASPQSNSVKDDDTEKQTKETMWAGWVDEHVRSPTELMESADLGETAASFSEETPYSVDGDVQNNHSASLESDSYDSSSLSDPSAANIAGPNQESSREHKASLVEGCRGQNQEGVSENAASQIEEQRGQNQESINDKVASLVEEFRGLNLESSSEDTASLVEECSDPNKDSGSEHASSLVEAEEWNNDDDIYYSDEDDLILDEVCENCNPPTPLSASPESPDVIIEEEFYLPSPKTSLTGLAPITEEMLEDDTVVNSRRSPSSIQAICEKDASVVDVTSSSRTDDVRSTKASGAEKPVRPRSLLGAFPATRPQFKLPRFLVNTVRQPINPLYHQVILDKGPAVTPQGDRNAGPEQRRFLFAKTAKLYYGDHPDPGEVQWEGGVKRYSRDVLLRFSHNPACNIRPSGLPALPCVQ